MEIHYIIVVSVISAIIIVQFYIFNNTKSKILVFKSIFPDSISSYSIIDENIMTNVYNVEDEAMEENMETINVSQIHIDTQNPTMQKIRNALNMYLQRNKGAASDFYLMKDVVERYCDAEEGEINIQQPIPLYLGLMGTMIGIIVGIGFIAVGGGLSSEALMDNITSLMTCVAIAMAASLVGICCTTILSWLAKSATSKVEAEKNRFYSWLQTELLPVLSGNAVNALYLLQQNLMTFNQTFQTNIDGLGRVLSKVEDSSREQIELITLIKDIDIKKVAQANVTVLKELKECTGEITVFNKYLHNVSGYLTAVNELNSNINEHLNRTAAIENMGIFFEREITQVTAREQYLNEVVAKVDNTLRKTFEQISESTKEIITQLRNNSVSEFDAILKHYSTQNEEFSKMLQEQHDEFAAKNSETINLIKEINSLTDIKNVMDQLIESTNRQTVMLDQLAASNSDMVGLVNEIHNLSEVGAVMRQLVKLVKGQTEMMEQLVCSFKYQNAANSIDCEPKKEVVPETEIQRLPKSIIYMVAIITSISIVAFGIYLFQFISTFFF